MTGPGTTVTARDNRIQGRGPIATISQNGIRSSSGRMGRSSATASAICPTSAPAPATASSSRADPPYDGDPTVASPWAAFEVPGAPNRGQRDHRRGHRDRGARCRCGLQPARKSHEHPNRRQPHSQRRPLQRRRLGRHHGPPRKASSPLATRHDHRRRDQGRRGTTRTPCGPPRSASRSTPEGAMARSVSGNVVR